MRYPSYGSRHSDRARWRHGRQPQLSRLGKTALVLGVALELVVVVRLLPAGALVFAALAFASLLALLMWYPLITVAVVVGAIGWRIERKRRARRAYEEALDDEIPF